MWWLCLFVCFLLVPTCRGILLQTLQDIHHNAVVRAQLDLLIAMSRTEGWTLSDSSVDQGASLSCTLDRLAGPDRAGPGRAWQPFDLVQH